MQNVRRRQLFAGFSDRSAAAAAVARSQLIDLRCSSDESSSIHDSPFTTYTQAAAPSDGPSASRFLRSFANVDVQPVLGHIYPRLPDDKRFHSLRPFTSEFVHRSVQSVLLLCRVLTDGCMQCIGRNYSACCRACLSSEDKNRCRSVHARMQDDDVVSNRNENKQVKPSHKAKYCPRVSCRPKTDKEPI